MEFSQMSRYRVATRPSTAIVALLIGMVASPALARQRDYSVADRHALAATPEDERTVDSLAKYLGGGKPSTVWDERVHFWVKNSSADEFKARTIYRWIADRISFRITIPSDPYGLHEYLAPDGRYWSRHSDPAYILKTRQAFCSTYAVFYLALADKVNLHCRYMEGEVAVSSDNWFAHAWNVVEIEGQWRAIDSTWAAG